MKRKYKIAAGVLAVLSILSIAVEWFRRNSWEAKAVTIIGGADGPTSIFLAGKIGSSDLFILAAVILLVSAVALLFLWRRKK